MINRELQGLCVQGIRKSHANLNGNTHDMKVLKFETERGSDNKMRYKNLTTSGTIAFEQDALLDQRYSVVIRDNDYDDIKHPHFDSLKLNQLTLICPNDTDIKLNVLWNDGTREVIDIVGDLLTHVMLGVNHYATRIGCYEITLTLTDDSLIMWLTDMSRFDYVKWVEVQQVKKEDNRVVFDFDAYDSKDKLSCDKFKGSNSKLMCSGHIVFNTDHKTLTAETRGYDAYELREYDLNKMKDERVLHIELDDTSDTEVKIMGELENGSIINMNVREVLDMYAKHELIGVNNEINYGALKVIVDWGKIVIQLSHNLY